MEGFSQGGCQNVAVNGREPESSQVAPVVVVCPLVERMAKI